MLCCGRRKKSTDTRKGLEEVRRITPTPYQFRNKFRCIFCFGSSCPKENYLKHRNPAIEGLHSDWVNSNIIAMQRPSSRLIREFNITEQFKKASIQAVVNLQLPGEHPFCGDGVLDGGFSYMPEELYKAGIFFYNFGWPDMKIPPTLDFILGAVKVMSFTINGGGKVAVHCHAGTGRTCLAIACYLVYNENMTSKSAIALIQSTRRGSLSSRAQRKYILSFERCNNHTDIREARLLFNTNRSLKRHLDFQSLLLHGVELKSLKSCPKLLALVIDASHPDEAEDSFCKSTPGVEPRYEYVKARSTQEQLNLGNWEALTDESAEVRAQVLLLWLEEISPPVLFELIPTQHIGTSLDNSALNISQKCILNKLQTLCSAAASTPLSERLSRALIGKGISNIEVSSLANWLKTGLFT